MVEPLSEEKRPLLLSICLLYAKYRCKSENGWLLNTTLYISAMYRKNMERNGLLVVGNDKRRLKQLIGRLCLVTY